MYKNEIRKYNDFCNFNVQKIRLYTQKCTDEKKRKLTKFILAQNGGVG